MKRPVISNIAKGAILSSCVLFASAAVLIKYTLTLLEPHPLNGVFISFIRFAIGAVLCLPLMAAVRNGFHFHDKKILVLRGITGAISMVFFYVAIQVNSSGRAILISDTYPIFVAVFGFLFFREKLKWKHLFSLPLAAAGALFVFYDKSSYRLVGDLTALMSAAFAGIAIHYIKIAREKNNPMVVYLVSCIFGVLLSLVPALMVLPDIYRQMSPMIGFLIVAIGTLVFMGQQFMTYGFKYVSATGGSILCLSEIVLTVLVSALCLDEKITARFLIGGVLVIAALVFALIERNGGQAASDREIKLAGRAG